MAEDLGTRPEDGWDDTALGGEPARVAGRDQASGVQRRRRETAFETLQRHGHHDRGVDAAGGGELVGGEAFDVLAERLTEHLRRRPRALTIVVGRSSVDRVGTSR